MFLSLPEELILLLLDDKSGQIRVRQQVALDVALGGAVLMDLALHSRVDSDLESLWINSNKPSDAIGHPILDPMLKEISETKEKSSINDWITRLYDKDHTIRNSALERLVSEGVLKQQEKKYLWLFAERRYPTIDGRAEREVKLRIMQILFSEDLPDPRDVSIIGLCNATGFFEELLGATAYRSVSEKIEQISKMDLIAHAISQVISNFILLRMQATPHF